MTKVLVGMSGGVDSAVTAYLLKKAGYEVIGVSFILWEARARTNFKTCCSLEASRSAETTAKQIGIEHYLCDTRDLFIEKVIEPFVDCYSRGITPNPCILCNKYVKFPVLLEESKKRGAFFIATGHYARTGNVLKTSNPQDGDLAERSISLKKALDSRKDQSYVLYILENEALKKLLLPLGEKKKSEVKKIARGLGLEAASRPESQEICFIEGKNYFEFIEKLSPSSQLPGPVLDMDGNVLGMHKGISCYTIGQRKGLGISSPRPLYVVRIDAMKNTLYVGRRQDVLIKSFFLESMHWIVSPTKSMFSATVKIRSMMNDAQATVDIISDRVRIIFDEDQWAPAPGQSAVLYDGDDVLGGGIITDFGDT